MNNLRRRLIKELDEGVEAGRCPHCNSKGAFLNGRVKCPKCGREIDEVAEKARDTKTTIEIPAPLVKSFNPSTAPASFIASLAKRAAEQGLNGDEPLSFEIPAAVRKAIIANRSGFMAMVKQFKDAAEIKTPESMKKSGTTPGAIKGWQTRRRGMAESDFSEDNIRDHFDRNGSYKGYGVRADQIAQVLDPNFDFGEEDSRSFTHQELDALETRLGIKLNEYDRTPFRYSGYSPAERKLHLINKLMGGHGVEHVDDQNKGGNVGRYSESSSAAMYVNTGDTYSPTVLYDVDADKFRLTSWGDFVENEMKESGDGYTRKPVRSRKSLLDKSMEAMQKRGTSAGAIKAAATRRRNKGGPDGEHATSYQTDRMYRHYYNQSRKVLQGGSEDERRQYAKDKLAILRGPGDFLGTRKDNDDEAMQKRQTSAGAIKAAETRRRNRGLQAKPIEDKDERAWRDYAERKKRESLASTRRTIASARRNKIGTEMLERFYADIKSSPATEIINRDSYNKEVRKSLLDKSMETMQKRQTSAGAIKAAETRRRNRGLQAKPIEGEGRQTPAQEGEGRQTGFRQDNRPDTSKILDSQPLLDEAGEKKQVRQWAKEPLSRLRRRQETNQMLLRRNSEEHKAATDPEHKQRLEEAGKKLSQIDNMLTAAVDRREFGRRR